MFKIKNLSYILILLLVSCTGYEWESMSSDNMKMVFTYNDKKNINQLDKYISSGELFIYKQNSGELVFQRALDKNEMLSPQGVTFTLPEGEKYTAVCWGNVDKYNTISDVESLASARVSSLSQENSKILESSDRLYYGTVEIDALNPVDNSWKTVALDFGTVHFKLIVEAKGFVGKVPVIELYRIVSGFNFYGAPVLDDSYIMKPSIIRNSVENSTKASLNLLKPDDLRTTLSFMVGDLESPILINLKDFIARNYSHIDITDRKEEIVIAILIEKKSISVDVTVPEWAVVGGDLDVDDNI